MRTTFAALAVIAAFSAACGAPKKDTTVPPPSTTLTMTLDRGTTSDIQVTMRLVNSAGAGVAGSPPVLQVTGGTASAVADAGSGDYTATVTPAMLDTEVVIQATAGSATAKKIALAFNIMDPSVAQPEAVDGLVNSPAWEDGGNISPDGNWLIVATYVPLDALSCGLANSAASDPACSTIIGPVTAPARPDILGGSRIHGSTYDNVCPSLGLTTPASFALMPVSAYGFQRLADGSFGNPFVIGFDADGCLGPFGYSFTGAPSGTAAGVVFSHHDPLANDGATQFDIYYAPLVLGQKNILARLSYSNGIQVSDDITVRVPPVTPIRQGNPTYRGGRLWWDNEDLAPADRDLMFSTVSGTLPAITATSAMTVGVSQAGVEEIQPMLDGDTLYFMSNGAVVTAKLAASADPAAGASWSARAPLFGPNTATGIVAIGQPTIAHVAGTTEVYFVYVKKTATGYDANIGRVKLR